MVSNLPLSFRFEKMQGEGAVGVGGEGTSGGGGNSGGGIGLGGDGLESFVSTLLAGKFAV